MVELRVRKFGDALGVVLPDEVIGRLKIGEGAALYLVETPESGYRLVPAEPGFETKMKKGEEIIDRYRNTLRVLAQ